MKLIVGLGNPGARYAGTRHNMGFLVVDALAQRAGVEINRERFEALLGRGEISDVPVILAKPLTFMNLSGRAVAQIVRYFGIGAADILIVHDDMDFPVGDVRIKAGGGAGGHKGLLSIIDQLGEADFARVRVGIGRPPARETAERYVLERFSAEETQAFDCAVERAGGAVIAVVSSGVHAAMNRFNAKIVQNSSEEV